MPIYLHRCPDCKRGREVLKPVAQCMDVEVCKCGMPMQRELTAPMVTPDIEPYRAVTGDRMGQFITSRREHREFLKRNRLVEVGNEPIRDTKAMRKTTSRQEIREELKRVVPEVLKKHRKRA